MALLYISTMPGANQHHLALLNARTTPALSARAAVPALLIKDASTDAEGPEEEFRGYGVARNEIEAKS